MHLQHKGQIGGSRFCSRCTKELAIVSDFLTRDYVSGGERSAKSLVYPSRDSGVVGSYQTRVSEFPLF